MAILRLVVTGICMRKLIAALAVGAVLAGCGPEVQQKPNFVTNDQMPTKMSLFIGGMTGSSFWISWDGIKLVYTEAASTAIGAERKTTIVETNAASWAEFMIGIEDSGFWQWNDRYENRTVLDGTKWKFIIVTSDTSKGVSGANAYPGTDSPNPGASYEFNAFLDQVSRLIGGRKFR